MLKKRLSIVLLVCVLIFTVVLAGCGDKAATEEQKSSDNSEKSEQTTSNNSQASSESSKDDKQSQESEEWKPDKPIQLIVPYAAGGAIDRVSRALEPYLTEYLGVPVSVVNMPGGSTVIAYEHVQNADKDGQTVLCLSPEVGTMAIMGHSELTPKDWKAIGISASFANAYAVHPDSPFQTMNDLIDALGNGENLTAGCAANGGAWSQGMMLLASLKDVPEPTFVPQGGGFVAAQAAMKKEVDFATCGLCEIIELLEGDELRCLGYFGTEPFPVKNYGDVPVIKESIPEAEAYSPFGGWTGLAVPVGTPDEIVSKLTEAFDFAAEQQGYKDFLMENAFSAVGSSGQAAEDYMNTLASVSSWLLYEGGFAKISPEKFGIARP
jgi:tripartite-type tricarboxylate transporter receptor subunit TctC